MTKTKKNTNIVTGCALSILILSILVILFMLFGSPSEPSDTDVKDIARTYVIKSLKDPSSSEFFHDENVIKVSDSLYNYTESLKAINGFGFKIPQKATVQVKWNGGEPSKPSSWELINIEFENL